MPGSFCRFLGLIELAMVTIVHGKGRKVAVNSEMAEGPRYRGRGHQKTSSTRVRPVLKEAARIATI